MGIVEILLEYNRPPASLDHRRRGVRGLLRSATDVVNDVVGGQLRYGDQAGLLTRGEGEAKEFVAVGAVRRKLTHLGGRKYGLVDIRVGGTSRSGLTLSGNGWLHEAETPQTDHSRYESPYNGEVHYEPDEEEVGHDR